MPFLYRVSSKIKIKEVVKIGAAIELLTGQVLRENWYITSFFPPFPGVITRSERFRFTLSDSGVVTSYMVSLSDDGISMI